MLQNTDIEFSAMMIKKQPDTKVVMCTTCGGKDHVAERCSSVIGYPPWHLKHKKTLQKGNSAQTQTRRPETKISYKEWQIL